MMETVKMEIESPKEITEVGIALGEMLKAMQIALKDGFQPGTDIPVIITSAIAHLGTAITGVQNIPDEFEVDPVMSVMGPLNPVALGIKEMLKLRK